jgi:hypothetical protein
MLTAASGACVFPAPQPIGQAQQSGKQPAPLAAPGAMEITPSVVAAGAPIIATGAGCAPNSTVVLRSDGEQVGQAQADGQGRFTAPLLFSTFTAGPHQIVATCGRQLTTTLEMTLTAASKGVSEGYAVLMFFLVAAFLVMRWQLTTGRR